MIKDLIGVVLKKVCSSHFATLLRGSFAYLTTLGRSGSLKYMLIASLTIYSWLTPCILRSNLGRELIELLEIYRLIGSRSLNFLRSTDPELSLSSTMSASLMKLKS